MDWVWLINDTPAGGRGLLPALKGATVLRVPAGRSVRLAGGPRQARRCQDHLYVVDPIGNLMMRFPPKLDAEGALKAKRDLDRLMRAAAFWDKAGR